jgi:hypothetical protein
MASTYSPSLRAELIGAGDQSGTWGSTTNNNFQYIFESAIAGYQTIPIAPTSNNQVLTYTNGPTSTASADQSVYAILKLNASAVSANFNLFTPPASKTYIVWNNTAYTATFYNSSVIGNTTAAGSGIAVLPNVRVLIWSDGTNFWSSNGSTGDWNVGGDASVRGNLSVTGTTTFNGIPSGPTATAGTSTTQLATTAFVQNVAGSLGTMSTQNANAVSITGGNIDALSTLAVTGNTDCRGRLFVADGSVSAPAITFRTDGAQDTGFYHSGDGVINVACNASNVGQFTTSGFNGTATNANKLNSYNGSNNVLFGWSGGGSLTLKIDSTDFGSSLPTNITGSAGAFQGKTRLGLGITGENWFDTGAFANGAVYTNTYGYPIALSVNSAASYGGSGSIAIYVGGVLVGFNDANNGGQRVCQVFIVPTGATWQVVGNADSASMLA